MDEPATALEEALAEQERRAAACVAVTRHLWGGEPAGDDDESRVGPGSDH